MRFDGMDAVAVRANRRLPGSVRDRQAMNALPELLLHRPMALAAGGGKVESKDWRLGVGSARDVVRTVAIGADRCFLHPLGNR